MRESPRDRRLRSFTARVGQDSGRSAPCVQPNTADGHQRENVRSARDVSPRSVQFSVAIDTAIFNTDQGAQFTSQAFTAVLKAHAVAIRMDGKGRWVDNVFVERLWRSVKYVKYEDVYLHAYETPASLRAGLTCYLQFYNGRRRHRALGRRTPDVVYFDATSFGTAA